MEKVYEVTFSQTFNESRMVFANSEEDAERRIREKWEDSVGGEVEVDNIAMVSETTEDHHENYDSGSSFKFDVENMIDGVKTILDIIDDSPMGRMLSHKQKKVS
jgi:hypothetical protein|tara:strand:+ start:862 stop:1173 length:312 start_codon:yes stop_codon:yes gene_type:complete